MAMMPPGPGLGPIAAPRPPQGPPPGMMPPMPPMPPVAPPPGGLGPASPLAGMLADLPTNLSPGWQCVDMAIRCLRTGLRSADMQKAPKVVAALQSVLNVMTKLLSAYTAGTASASSSPDVEPEGAQGGQPPSTDADAQPSAESSDSE